MLTKYNIALIPETLSPQIIELASSFSPVKNSYLLGENSLPHVTIYQFYSEPGDINAIIEKITVSTLCESVELVFESFSFTSFDQAVYWISLLPDKVSELDHMHTIVSTILNKSRKNHFDPHMTLVNTKDKASAKLIDSVKKTYTPIRDKFILSIGESDDVGQYKKVIHR